MWLTIMLMLAVERVDKIRWAVNTWHRKEDLFFVWWVTVKF